MARAAARFPATSKTAPCENCGNSMRQLDAALTLDDLRHPPGNRLEALRADRAGQMSIRINDQWRIYFRWANGDALDVEIVDYH
jgi:toxin HigB-1